MTLALAQRTALPQLSREVLGGLSVDLVLTACLLARTAARIHFSPRVYAHAHHR
jgi:hypothetical protein